MTFVPRDPRTGNYIMPVTSTSAEELLQDIRIYIAAQAERIAALEKSLDLAVSAHQVCLDKYENLVVLKDHYASGYLGSLQAALRYEDVLRTIDNWLVCSPIATAEDMATSFEPMHNLIEEALNAHTLQHRKQRKC